MKCFLFAATGLALAATAEATPVYLECPVSGPGGKSPLHLQVTLNEEAGTAGYVIVETGFSQQGLKASFSPKAVMWTRRDNAYGETRFGVDRTTLQLTEVTYLQGNVWSQRTGTCSLMEVKGRKF